MGKWAITLVIAIKKFYSLKFHYNVLQCGVVLSVLLSIGLLLPLIIFLSGIFFKHAKRLSNFLILLSNKLETLWPLLIMEFLCIIVSKLHSMLATHFEEFISHAYIKPYEKTISCESHTNQKHFTR